MGIYKNNWIRKILIPTVNAMSKVQNQREGRRHLAFHLTLCRRRIQLDHSRLHHLSHTAGTPWKAGTPDPHVVLRLPVSTHFRIHVPRAAILPAPDFFSLESTLSHSSHTSHQSWSSDDLTAHSHQPLPQWHWSCPGPTTSHLALALSTSWASVTCFTDIHFSRIV